MCGWSRAGIWAGAGLKGKCLEARLVADDRGDAIRNATMKDAIGTMRRAPRVRTPGDQLAKNQHPRPGRGCGKTGGLTLGRPARSKGHLLATSDRLSFHYVATMRSVKPNCNRAEDETRGGRKPQREARSFRPQGSKGPGCGCAAPTRMALFGPDEVEISGRRGRPCLIPANANGRAW
jgi:hypothetical protein